MVGRRINGAAAEDQNPLDAGRPCRLENLGRQIEVLGDPGHGVVGRDAGTGHRAGGVKDEIDPLHRRQAILLPGQIATDGLDARIGDDGRALMHARRTRPP